METSKIEKIQVVIHSLPREIDQLERVLNSLRESYFYVTGMLDIILDVSLNVNEFFIDWEKSTLPKEFFISKFKTLESIHDWTYQNVFTVEDSDRCLGINDKRRNSINDDIEADYILYLDLDFYFPNVILYLFYNYYVKQTKKKEYIIISPETVKLWDESWNGLVNETFKDKDYEFFKTIDPYSVNFLAFKHLMEGSTGLRENTPIKLGGGWFNLFSKNLLRFINIPESLGSYGLDDTFIMMGAEEMRKRGYDVAQYILKGGVCIENNSHSLYDYNPYSEYLEDHSFKNKGRDFKKKAKEQSHLNFQKELIKLVNRL